MTITTLMLTASLLLGSAYFTYRNVDFSQSMSAEGLPLTARNSKESKIDINQFLSGVIENFKDDMKVGIPGLKIPILDPYVSKEPIRVDVQDKMTSAQGNFTDVHIEGLSTFIMDSLEADIQNLTVTLQLHVPKSKAYGHYSIDGQVFGIVPLKGNGKFRIEPQNLRLGIKVSLESSDEYLQLAKDFDVEMDIEEVELNLENFVGGSRWDEILGMLNTTKEELFKRSVPMLKVELNKTLFKVINNQLKKLPIRNIKPGSSPNEYVDQILKYVQNYLINKDLDPMALPDYKGNFSKEIMLVNFNGEAKMYDGQLFGLSTIHRADNCKLKTNTSTITISANLGLSALRITYKGHVKFMSFGPTVTASGQIHKIDFYFKIQQSNKKGARPVLREFEVVQMSTLWIDLSGLGPLTWIMKWLLTGLSTLIENFIHEKMTDTMRGYIQNELQKYAFPV